MKYVISLGGSLIIPKEIDVNFLKRFSVIVKDLIKKGNSVVLVCGGGSIARKYISVVTKMKFKKNFESLVGIETTKLNASLVASFFGKFHLLPDSLNDVYAELKKDKIVVCGALGFQPKMTSDGDAAMIAQYINADYFINLTNIDGLYDKNPAVKGAKQISNISFKKFDRIVSKINYKAGQHFVLDQAAAKIIMKEKIETVILKGSDLKNLERFFSKKSFIGTVING